MIDLEQKSPIEQSLIRWLYDFATFGILVTDTDLRIVYANSWFTKHLGADAPTFLGSPLIDAFPDMRARAFERFYQDALSGQTRVLSQRFHGYLFKMRPATGSGPAQMQQSARISPLLLGSTVVGTISFIEDVSERVRHENELHFQIDERSRLLESEISARELAEENERLRDASEMLRIEGAQLLELGRDRDMLMHRIIAGQEEERKRIARNIHDHLGQQLTALRYSLSLIKPQMTEGTPLCESVRRAQAIAENLDREVDYLSWELRPAEIDDIGLEEALKTLIREWTAHYGIEVKFHSVGLGETSFSPDTEINLYRIVQEALTNISKHANANKVFVSLEKHEGRVVLIVEDNGVGFDVAEKAHMSAGDRGMGLFGMYERAALVGANAEIKSEPRLGTSIFVDVPLARA